MFLKSNFVLFIFIFLLLSCSRKEIIHFYSLDKKQCLTVITEDSIRYVINGKYKSCPDTNFVKLDVSEAIGLGDGVHILWKNADYDWEVVVQKSSVLLNKLDTSKYCFSTNLPKDEQGRITEKKFRGENGAVFSYYLMKLSPNKGAIVEIK